MVYNHLVTAIGIAYRKRGLDLLSVRTRLSELLLNEQISSSPSPETPGIPDSV